MRQLPPLDVHTHVSTEISAAELERLGAVTLIATRSTADFEKVAGRSDLVSVWGVGCHPSLVRVQAAFVAEKFKEALTATPYIAEVGLDGDSRVPINKQTETLRSILRVVDQNPRIISLHSYKATSQLLDLLSEQSSRKGQILHWWLGDENETKRAIDLGCFFSINYSMIRSGDAWSSIPLDRLFLETDHPFGDRFSKKPRQPGYIQDIEEIVAKRYGISKQELRQQIWKNFATIVLDTSTLSLFPKPVQSMIDSVVV